MDGGDPWDKANLETIYRHCHFGEHGDDNRPTSRVAWPMSETPADAEWVTRDSTRRHPENAKTASRAAEPNASSDVRSTDGNPRSLDSRVVITRKLAVLPAPSRRAVRTPVPHARFSRHTSSKQVVDRHRLAAPIDVAFYAPVDRDPRWLTPSPSMPRPAWKTSDTSARHAGARTGATPRSAPRDRRRTRSSPRTDARRRATDMSVASYSGCGRNPVWAQSATDTVWSGDARVERVQPPNVPMTRPDVGATSSPVSRQSCCTARCQLALSTRWCV